MALHVVDIFTMYNPHTLIESYTFPIYYKCSNGYLKGGFKLKQSTFLDRISQKDVPKYV